MEQCEKEAHSFHLFVSHSVPTPWVSLHLATSTNRQTAPDGGESGVELEQEQEEEEEEEQESSNQPRTLPCPRWSWSRTRASCNFIPSVVHWVLGCRAGFGPDLYLLALFLMSDPFDYEEYHKVNYLPSRHVWSGKTTIHKLLFTTQRPCWSRRIRRTKGMQKEWSTDLSFLCSDLHCGKSVNNSTD